MRDDVAWGIETPSKRPRTTPPPPPPSGEKKDTFKQLRHEDPGIRRRAVENIRDGGMEIGPELAAELTLSLGDESTDVRIAALQGLQRSGKAGRLYSGAVAARLGDSSTCIRIAAADTLGHMGDAAAPHASALANLVRGGSLDTAKSAGKALARLKDAGVDLQAVGVNIEELISELSASFSRLPSSPEYRRAVEVVAALGGALGGAEAKETTVCQSREEKRALRHANTRKAEQLGEVERRAKYSEHELECDSELRSLDSMMRLADKDSILSATKVLRQYIPITGMAAIFDIMAWNFNDPTSSRDLRLSIAYVYHEMLKWCKHKESNAAGGEEHLYSVNPAELARCGLKKFALRIGPSVQDMPLEHRVDYTEMIGWWKRGNLMKLEDLERLTKSWHCSKGTIFSTDSLSD